MIHHSRAAVNPARPEINETFKTGAQHCDTCTRPIGIVAPYTIDTTARNICRFCRHSLRYANIGNILRLIDRFFAEGVTA